MTHPAALPLDALADEAWSLYLEANPLFATATGVGDGAYDGALLPATPADRVSVLARYEAIAASLDALPDPRGEHDGADAAAAAAIDRSALRETVAFETALLRSGLIDWNVDALDGIPVQLLQAGDFQPATTPADGARLLERWRAMPAYTDAHAATLRRSLADGLIACRAPVERVADMIGELLATPDADWPLLAPVAQARGSAAWRPADADRFAADVLAVVRGEIRPAFARLRATLLDEIAPAARPEDRPGLLHVEGGADAYRALVRGHTSLDVTPEELHRIGLAEIERIDAEMEALAARVLGTRSRPEAIAALRSDPALHFATRDEVHAKAVSTLARAYEAIPGWFGRLPVAPCEVVRMGPHEEEHTTIAYYRSPAEDGSRPGQHWINTSHPETRPRYEAEALAYHESVPGHHLQIAIGQELRGLKPFRRHLGPTAFFEGWGLYTERLADEMGLYTGDLDRIGVLSFDAWRASRLVVDTGMHALGWTRRQAIDFMTDHTALGENNIVNEIDRYIVLPGQALAYKTGQLEMLRLRAEAQAALGPAFDVRAFHDTLLGNGALPLPTLRGVVEAWVARTAAGG
jgi:uncharacterized protein (DUF885 family)